MNKPEIIIDNDIQTLTELEPNLFHWHVKSVELQLKDYMYIYNLGNDRCKSTGKKIDVINSHAFTFTFAPETWNFISDRHSDFSFINAQAVIVKQLHIRVLARIVAKIRKKTYKFKVFSNYEDALEWIVQPREVE